MAALPPKRSPQANTFPGSNRGNTTSSQLAAVGKSTNNKWFLVGLAAADLKLPEASGSDDTDKNKDEG